MKNKEKYWDKIIERLAYDDEDFCPSDISKTICSRKTCRRCISEWLEEEFVPKVDCSNVVDWSNVEVDTPILVWDGKSPDWCYRHFAEVDDDGYVVTWGSGTTSWTKYGVLESWRFAKLAESED